MMPGSLPQALLLAVLCSLMGPALAANALSLEHKGVTFDIYRLEKGEEQDLRFFWKNADGTPYSSIYRLRRSLSARGERLAFAVNGGIYSADFTPLGLYIEDGKRYYRLTTVDGGGNFFLKPNGVFYITPEGASIVDTEDYEPRHKVLNAIQSGPLLVKNGELHPRFIPDYHSKYVRNGVGVDREGRVVFAISDAPVNFHDFGTLFRDALDCVNALYLDGNISEMYAPELNRNGGWPWRRFTTIIGLPSNPDSAPRHQ